MTDAKTTLRKLDVNSLEMILVVALITLHDFLLSDSLSLPLALQHSPLARARYWDKIVSGSEFLIPVIVFSAMIILWLIGNNAWVYKVTIVFLGWVTLRLTAKVALVLLIIVSHPLKQAPGLLKDTIVLWLVNFLLFGVWYWIIDAGGPRIRRTGTPKRFNFGFPQRAVTFHGWEGWQTKFWNYVFLGFCGSIQFGLGDTLVRSVRAKFLLMIQATLSVAIIVFIASIAIGHTTSLPVSL